MTIDLDTLDSFFDPAVISWDGNEALMHANTAFFVYYVNGKAELNGVYREDRRQEIIGVVGYDMALRKYLFTVYKPGGGKPDARIIPSSKQVVANNSVQVDKGESIQVQNHQRTITFLIRSISRTG